ncbi:MAG: hypothetical protein IPK91_15665 [Saprospiraceae bacterium]|nr:hypothetical protein [Saprospiraceae bacterium]
MDNHLAASWCWMQNIDPSKKYNYFHIDRHYDLLDSQIDSWLKALESAEFNFRDSSINELISINYNPLGISSQLCPVFRWDNYFTILRRYYPDLINLTYFATHQDGDKSEEFEMYEPAIIELHGNINFWIDRKKENRWILNLDIDYFFTDNEDKCFQFLSDEYILLTAEEIKKSWDLIDVFTIALSPEFCGGWEESIRVAKLITNHLNIDWDINEIPNN